MCGIAGIIAKKNKKVYENQLTLMANSLLHRGPDGSGYWINANNTIGLAHRRLSIIDLSENGKQPMHYMDRYTITYNGEVYNYLEIKLTLQQKGYTFKTESDTEVLMACYDCYKDKCLDYIDGMFAFVIYDSITDTFFCAVDRFGEKPLYYTEDNDYIYFASEMKALWALGIRKQVSEKRLAIYLVYDFVENPNDLSSTFYENIKLLYSSTSMTIDVGRNIATSTYWSYNYTSTANLSEADAFNKFKELFNQSVSVRLRSDVPVGSCLSGGLDSSTIVGIINKIKQTKQEQKTFSVRFNNFEKDEGFYIDEITRKLSLDAYATYPDAEKLISEFDIFCWHQEEPVWSASQFLQWEVFKLAKENNVTVLIDGQGADELLAGYPTYYSVYYRELYKKNNKSLNAELKGYKDVKGYPFDFTLKDKISPYLQLDYFRKAKFLRTARNENYNNDIIDIIKGENFFKTPSTLKEALHQSQFRYGLHSLIRFGDRNSMAFSREVRLPFLSFEFVEFVMSLPESYFIKEGWSKYILRKAFENTRPNNITWKAEKIGFEPPQKIWLKQKRMKEMIADYQESLMKKGIINGPINNSWKVLMLGNFFS